MFFAKYYYGCQIKDNVWDGTCSTHNFLIRIGRRNWEVIDISGYLK